MSKSEPKLGRLAIERAAEGTRLVLRLRGELDLASAPSLRSELHAATSDGVTNLVIDLSGLDFMDSTGIGLLIAAQRAAEENRCEFSVRRGPEQIQRVLEITGVADRIPFED